MNSMTGHSLEKLMLKTNFHTRLYLLKTTKNISINIRNRELNAGDLVQITVHQNKNKNGSLELCLERVFVHYKI